MGPGVNPEKMHSLVDTHAHLEEMEDLEGVIERAKARGVVAIVAVGSDYESNCRTLEIAEGHRGYVYPALGLHPWNLRQAAPHLERDLRFIEDHIREIVAIGEIGLDYRKDILGGASKDLQKNVLHSCLELAKRHHKPALVHSRYAWRDCLDVVRGVGVGRVVFHWFTGPMSVLRDILGRGYRVSATLAAEYHEEHRRAIREAPLENLMLETDAPVVYRGHRSEPADVGRSLRAVAELKSLEPDQVARRTTENALRFYGLRVGEEV